jgi:hypothetical protein
MAYKKSFIELTKEPRISRIKLVGIELEGGWSEVPTGIEWVGHAVPAAGQLGRDGSLDPLAARNPTCPYVGELPSKPMPEGAVEKWLKAHYPAIIGPECGMHIHISLTNDLLYMKLMDDEAYPATVVEYLRRWAVAEKIAKTDPIWGRLAGTCIYCQHLHMPDEQVSNTRKDWEKHRKGHRYTALNFCYNRVDLGKPRNGLEETTKAIGTIECRLLSMPENAEMAARAVKEFIRVTNGFLLATGAKKEKKKSTNFAVDVSRHVDRLRVQV